MDPSRAKAGAGRLPWLGLVLALATSACSGQGDAEEVSAGDEAASGTEVLARRHPDRLPDLALVLIDTLRVSRLGLGGAELDPMPRLSALADSARHYPRAYSSSTFTPPATASALTGVYPARHGVIYGLRSGKTGAEQVTDAVRLQAPSLPQLLGEAGYDAVGLAANFNIGSELGFDDGFLALKHVPRTDAEGFLPTLDELPPPGEQPRFTYLHYNDPHAPLTCRPPACAEPSTQVQRYDSELTYLDGHLDAAVERLRADAGVRQRDLVVVVVSDHGELFGEHGLRGHPAVMVHELQHVVFIVQVPGLPPGEDPARVSLVDVAPTLLELVGLPARDLDGVSLLPSLRGEGGPPDTRPLFAHRLNPDAEPPFHLWSVIQGDSKLVQSPERAILYTADEPEQRGRGLLGGAEHEALSAALEAHRRAAVDAVTVPIHLDPEVAEALRVMGYVED